MNCIRLAALALLAAALPAQDPPVVTPPGVSAEAVNRPLTPEEKKQQLLEQMRKLQEELDFLNRTQVVGGVVGRVSARFKERAAPPQQLDDPGTPAGTSRGTADTTPAPSPQGQTQGDAETGDAQPKPAQAKKARLLGDAEKKAMPAGTIFTVDGIAVNESEFQAVYGYLKSLPNKQSDDDLRTTAIETLIRRRAAEAAFPAGAKAARDRVVKAQQQLKAGTDFAEVAKTMSDCPSKAQGGDLNWFGRGVMDTSFTIAAFGLKDGDVSEPVQTMFGYHLIKRTGFKKGDDPTQDQVRASHVLAMYADDQFKVREVQMKVNQGQVDVGFVSDEYRKYAPAYLK